MEQVIEAAKKFMSPHNLDQVGIRSIKAVCRPREIAIVTLYRLGEMKKELIIKLREKARRDNIDAEAYVYGIDDILEGLKGFSRKRGTVNSSK